MCIHTLYTALRGCAQSPKNSTNNHSSTNNTSSDCSSNRNDTNNNPNLPTKIIPANIPGLELSVYFLPEMSAWEFHPVS